jgi:hypothetical protein
MGDASYSMDIGTPQIKNETKQKRFPDGRSRVGVAIRTATIIGSLLAALTKADLLFFNVKSFTPKVSLFFPSCVVACVVCGF